MLAILHVELAIDDDLSIKSSLIEKARADIEVFDAAHRPRRPSHQVDELVKPR